MMMLGATKNSSRNTNGGPLTSHLVARSIGERLSRSSGWLAMQEYSRIMAPADAHRIAHLVQLGAPRRRIGQQRFEQQAVFQLHLEHGDVAAIEEIVDGAGEVVFQFAHFAVRAQSHLLGAD